MSVFSVCLKTKVRYQSLNFDHYKGVKNVPKSIVPQQKVPYLVASAQAAAIRRRRARLNVMLVREENSDSATVARVLVTAKHVQLE